MGNNDVFRHQPGINLYFYTQRLCFGRVGINITSLERTIASPAKFWCLSLSLLALCIPIVLYTILNIQDLDKATDSLSIFWQMVMAVFKLLYFKFNSKHLILVLRKMWLWNLETKGEELAILACENRQDVVFCKYYHFSVVTTGVLAVLVPFGVAGFYAWNGEPVWEYLEAPITAQYYFDKVSILGYFIAYFWDAIVVYVIVFASLSIDGLYSWFMCNIVAHFRILKYRLHQAGKGNNGNSSAEAICNCIAYHCRTLEFAKEFIGAFRVIVFIKFTISCLQVCCLAIQLSRDTVLFDQLFHFSFLMSVSMQLALYCFGGQRIQNESESIADEIYESFNWEQLTVSNKKMLIFSMKRAQETCNVSGIFFIANSSLYLWVYRTAFSLVTLLWTMEEKENEKQ